MTVKCLSTSFLRQHVPNYDSTVIFLASCPEPHHNPLPNRDSLQLLQSMQCVAQSYGWNVCEFPVAEESPCREFPETHISAANTQNTENAPTDPQFFHPTKYTKCAKWPPVQIHIHFMQERICLLNFCPRQRAADFPSVQQQKQQLRSVTQILPESAWNIHYSALSEMQAPQLGLSNAIETSTLKLPL